MKIPFKQFIFSFTTMMMLLVVLEIVSSALLPSLGIMRYRIPFNILLVIYLGFKIQAGSLPILVFLIQYLHSFFSVEGWAIGTFTGIVVAILVTVLKDILHISNLAMTIIVSLFFQIVWFIISLMLFYMKFGDGSLILEKLWRFIPESIFLSLIAPPLFYLLDRIWRIHYHQFEGDVS